MASKYKATGALPQITVLDNDGSVLAGRAAADFRAVGGAAGGNPFDAEKINEFLAGFKPAYPNAEELFTSAITSKPAEGPPCERAL